MSLLSILVELGYQPGAILLDAIRFVPQTRERLFICCVRNDVKIPERYLSSFLGADTRLIKAFSVLPENIKQEFLWWNLPPLPPQNRELAANLELHTPWDSKEEAARLLTVVSQKQRNKIRDARKNNQKFGVMCRRTRTFSGRKALQTEFRFEGSAYCLRTAKGGLSRQWVINIQGEISTRPMTPREGARLMGLSESYILPGQKTQAFNILGDGVAVPVVKWLSTHLLLPIAEMNKSA